MFVWGAITYICYKIEVMIVSPFGAVLNLGQIRSLDIAHFYLVAWLSTCLQIVVDVYVPVVFMQ